ncbi:excalibur calcium-binding domain-containing protein [Pseudonocardia xinjiangensis]|uniref:excalibur calcium-binding domain-containing protein n=1 Tax=Pseudonocardia xinjiangensis TaxID=75289 RepID=UPI003D91346C
MRVRTTAAAIVLAAASSLTFAGLAHAQPGDNDCGSYSSQEEAQTAFDDAADDDNVDDLTNLDEDNDGNACDDFDFAANDDNNDDNNAADDTTTAAPAPAPQVAAAPAGGVDTGDGSTDDMLPGLLVLSGLTTLGAGAGALALRRSARRSD